MRSRSQIRILALAAGMIFLVAGMLCAQAADGVAKHVTLVEVFRWRPFLAPFHSVVLHFPIAFITMAFIFEIYGWWRPSPDLPRLVRVVLILGIVTAGVSILFGVMRATDGDYDARVLSLHRKFGFAVGIMTLAVFGAHWLAYRGKGKPALQQVYRMLLLANVIAVVIAGHQGGNLTHGSNYLVKNAPEVIKELLSNDDEISPGDASADEKDRMYFEKIQPIFQNRCYECHGQEKQKGGLRLDQREAVLKGGKSGEPAIKPGDPMHSNLVRLITLPDSDDDVMPPEGKKLLNGDEVLDIIRWIQAGASFGEKEPAAITSTPTGDTNKAEQVASESLANGSKPPK